MHLRTAALALAVMLPATGAAAERPAVRAEPPSSSASPIYGPMPADEAQPQAPAEPMPAEPTTPAETESAEGAPAEPLPAEATSEALPPIEPTAPVAPASDEIDYDRRLAESMRETGASVMIGSGLVTIAGLVLIFTGTGVATAVVRKAGCSDPNLCALDEAKMMHAGRTLLAGFVISGAGAVGLIGGIAAYAIGKGRADRARLARASLDGFAFAPSGRGLTLGVRGRF